jgi:hypothetical protein
MGARDGVPSGDPAGRRPHHFQRWTTESFCDAVCECLNGMHFIPDFFSVCAVCGQDKDLLSLGHGDSSAMFDEVLEQESLGAFDELRTRVEERTQTVAAAVQRSGNHRAWLTSDGDLTERQQQTRGIHLVPYDHARQLLNYTAETNYSRVGKHVIRREKGVAMGSPQSPCKSGLV